MSMPCRGSLSSRYRGARTLPSSDAPSPIFSSPDPHQTPYSPLVAEEDHDRRESRFSHNLQIRQTTSVTHQQRQKRSRKFTATFPQYIPPLFHFIHHRRINTQVNPQHHILTRLATPLRTTRRAITSHLNDPIPSPRTNKSMNAIPNNEPSSRNMRVAIYIHAVNVLLGRFLLEQEPP